MDDREYDQLDSLTSSSNMEISRLSLVVKNLRIRLASLEKNQTDLMDKINEIQKKIAEADDNDDQYASPRAPLLHQYPRYSLIEEALSAMYEWQYCMSQTQPNATKYNDGSTDARTNLLRIAKVEESQIATLAKSRFETLPKDVQEKLNAPVSSA